MASKSIAAMLVLTHLTSILDWTSSSSPLSSSSSSSSSSLSSSSTICPIGCICSRTFNSVNCHGGRLEEIPRNLEQSTTSLDFSKNSLTYINAQTFMFLKKLVQLKLNHNEIESIADGSFGQTSSLQSIDLSSNGLSDLRNYTFTGADMLLRLDVSDNKLTEINGTFANMRELSRLNLCKNRLTSINEHTFLGLVNIRYLLLCDNSIRSIDRNSFSHMDKLMYIVLKNNILKHLDEIHFTSTFLSYVDLSECWLDSIPKGLPNSIRYLQLRRNNLTFLDSLTFQDCRFISILVLDENKIQRIEKETFDGMIYLQQLWLNGNRLRMFSSRLSTNLQRLFLDSNLLKTFPSDIFPSDSVIDTLSLAANEIETLPEDGFRNLRSLKKLDLSGNRIGRLKNESLFHLSKLNVLDLSRNHLKFFHRHSFRSLGQLEKLYLSYVTTSAPQIDPDAFQGLENVAKLDLESSSGLILKLTTSDDFLSCFSGVRELNLKKSQLTGLRYDFFEFFPNLSHLKISSNRWCCDKTLSWLKNWFKNLPRFINVTHLEDNFCHSPFELRGQSIWKSKFVDYTDFTCHVFTRTPAEDDDGDPYPVYGHADSTVKSYLSEFKPNRVDTVIYDWEEDLESSSFFSPQSTARFTPTTGGDDDDSKAIATKNSTRLIGLSFTRPSRTSQRDFHTARKKPFQGFATIVRSNSGFPAVRPPATPSNAHLLSDYQIYESSPSSETFFVLAIVLISVIVLIGIFLLIFILCLVSKSIKAAKTVEDQKHNSIPHATLKINTENRTSMNNEINGIDPVPAENQLSGQYFLPLANSRNYGSDADGRMIKHCSSPSSISQRLPRSHMTSGREFMTLISGKDAKQDGPLKVYKWADF